MGRDSKVSPSIEENDEAAPKQEAEREVEDNPMMTDTLSPNKESDGITVGLELLEHVDYLKIKQDHSIGESIHNKSDFRLFTNMHFSNAYHIFDKHETRLYVIGELSSSCLRRFCKTARPFRFEVSDANGNSVLKIKRGCSCGLVFCNGYCFSNVTIMHSSRKLLGRVHQEFFSCRPSFIIHNEMDEPVARVIGPFCSSGCPECIGCSAVFNIFTICENSRKIGCVTKSLTSFCTECCTVADMYEIFWDENVDVNLKATLLGMALTIDFAYFETTNWARGPFFLLFVSVLVIVVIALLATGIVQIPFLDFEQENVNRSHITEVPSTSSIPNIPSTPETPESTE